MTKRRIYVHGQQAHLDETIASAIVISTHPEDDFEIIRDSKEWVNAAPEDFVLDVGEQYDNVRLFDHHQKSLPHTKENGSECAATLVAQAFAPWMFHDPKMAVMLEMVRVLDTMGPNQFKKRYFDLDQYTIPMGLAEMFEEAPTETAKAFAKVIAKRRTIGEKMPSYLKWLEENSCNDNAVLVIESNTNEAFSPQDDRGLLEAQTRHAEREGSVMIYGFHRRNPDCRSLFRTALGEDLGYDLTKAKPEDEEFTHVNGFIQIFRPKDENEFKKLVKAAEPEKQ